MKDSLDKLLNSAGRAMEAAAQTTGKMVNKGRDKVETYNLQQKLGKAEQQLGALVYMLQKTGQENPPMMEHYMKEIDNIKMQLSILDVPEEDMDGFVEDMANDSPIPPQFREESKEDPVTIYQCPQCGSEVDGNAMFCSRCGAQLSK